MSDEKEFDIGGSNVSIYWPEVMEMLRSSRKRQIICECDYETALALHEILRDRSLCEATSGDVPQLIYTLIEVKFQMWVMRRDYDGETRIMTFRDIATLKNFKPHFETRPKEMIYEP